MDLPYVSKIRQESSLAIVDRWTVALLNSLLGKAEEMVDVDSKVTICQKTLDKDSRREKCFFQFKPRLSWHLPIIVSGSNKYSDSTSSPYSSYLFIVTLKYKIYLKV